jgi:transcriptional regulator with XRE-family HTH domain
LEQDLAIAVGQRVRRLRTQAGFSLRRQAELSGVSASALSALENGRGGMSISALQRVGAFFDLTITDLLAVPSQVGDRDAPAIEVFRPAGSDGSAVERGHGVMYRLLGDGRDHALQPYMLSFAPGAGYDVDAIGHAGEEFAYVAFGEVELLFGTERRLLAFGDSVRFRTDTPHAFRNPSSSMAAVVVGAATPPW